MKKIVKITVVALCIGFGSSAFASSPATPEAAAKQGQEMTEQVKEMVYKGIVKKHEDGTALITKDKTYPLEGGDFAMIIGKEVNVVGKVVKDGDVEKLVVTKLQMDKQ